MNDLAEASKQTGSQVEEASGKFRNFVPRARAQAEAALTATDANIALGAGAGDAAAGLLKALEAVNGFAKASAKIGEGGLNADIGKIKDGLGEMANATGLTELAMKRLGAGPLLALQMAADVAAFVADAFVQGQLESDKFSRALELTGNAAGITEGQFNTMVASVAGASQGGLGDTRVVLQTLVETGQFTSEALNSVGAAAVTMAQMNGQSAGTVAADFATMADGVTNWVDTHDKNYNILTGAQYAHIAALEKEGKTQEAMVMASDLINAGLQKRAEKLSMIGSLLQGSKNLWSSFMDGMRSIGREETPEDEIEKIKKRTAEVRRTGQLVPGTHPAARLTGAQMEQFEQEQAKALAVAMNKKTQLEAKAKADQNESKRNADSKQAVKELDEMQKRYVTKAQRETAEIMKFEETLASAKAGGYAVSPEREKELRQSMRASFAAPARSPAPPAAGSDPRDAVLAGALQTIQSELKMKTEGYDQLAKLDELRRKGGILSEEQYFESRKNAIRERGKAEADAYQKQIDVLSAFKAKTPLAVQENRNKIAEAGAAKERVDPKTQAELAQVEENARQQAAETRKKREDDAQAKMAKDRADVKAADEQQWKQAADGAKALGDALEKAFGKVGGTIGKVTSALVEHKKAQQEIQRTLANAKQDANGDKPKKIAAESKAQLDSTQAQMKGYSDMAGAAAGFFDEQSAGYKALTTVSQVFHAAEVAMTLAELVPKGISAVLSQGSGDPYTAFGRMAAMAAIVAGLGVAIGGGGGGGGNVDVAKERQKANGTGTVLGDPSAKSDSIARSLAIMEKNSGLGLAHTISMDNSLRKLAAGIGNLANLLARESVATGAGGAAAGVQTGTKVLGGTLGVVAGMSAGGVGGAMLGTYLGMGMAAIGGPIGLILGSVVGTVLGSVVSKLFNTSKTVVDQGITGKAMSLGQIEDIGFTAQSYADVNTKKKALGFTYSNKNKTETAAMSDDVNKQFTMIIVSMGNAIRGAANVMGVAGGDFNARMDAFKVDLGKISLKGLSAEEQQKALETAFSALGDKMADAGVAGLRDFAKIGEGAFETLNRIANDFQQVGDVLFVLGKSFAATGMAAVKLSEDLIDTAGGLEKLTSGTSYFYENFLSESEKMAPVTKSVNDAMGKLGLGGVTTMDGFKAAVLSAADGVATGKDGAAELYVALLSLAEPFKKAAGYAADLAGATGEFATAAKTAGEVASERRGLQSQLDSLTSTTAQVRARERAQIAEANRALYDEVTARNDLSAAYTTQSEALKSTIDRLKTFGDGIRTFKDSLLLGSLSTLTPLQKMAEAQRQYEETLAKAKTGDAAAQSALTAAATAYLTANQVVKSSSDAYAADAARVQADLAALAAIAGTQMSDAQKQLTALDTQVGQLINLNKTAVGIQEAVDALGAALRAGGKTDVTSGMQFAASFGMPLAAAFDEVVVDAPAAQAMQRYFSAGDGANEALVAEIKGLREEVRQLRADQDQQTGAIISSNYDANERAADKVSAGASEAARASVWASQSKASIV